MSHAAGDEDEFELTHPTPTIEQQQHEQQTITQTHDTEAPETGQNVETQHASTHIDPIPSHSSRVSDVPRTPVKLRVISINSRGAGTVTATPTATTVATTPAATAMEDGPAFLTPAQAVAKEEEQFNTATPAQAQRIPSIVSPLAAAATSPFESTPVETFHSPSHSDSSGSNLSDAQQQHQRRPSKSHHRVTSIAIHSPPEPQRTLLQHSRTQTGDALLATAASASTTMSPSPIPAAPASAGNGKQPKGVTQASGGVRSVFELTELDMLRLRPFIHGVHVRVQKKRTRWTFGSDSLFRRWWCAIRSLFILTFMILIPLRACFTVQTDRFPVTLILDYIIDGFFFLDFFAWNVVFSSYDYSQGSDGTLLYRPKDISRHYRKWSGFKYDFLAMLPIDYIFIPFGMWNVILWIRMSKLIRIPNLLISITSVHPNLIKNQIDPVVKRMVVVFATIYVGIHWAACGWNLLRNGLARDQEQSTSTIISGEDISYQELANQYVTAIYFIQSAVVTLGYGDIVAESTREVLFMTFVMIFGFIAQACLVGHLITLLKHRLGKRAWYRASLLQLKQYCLMHDLSPPVTRRLFHYYHYLWTRQKGLDEQQLLLNDFPPIYLSDFGVEITLDILAQIPFLSLDNTCSPPAGFIRALIPYMYPETFCPNITILQQGVSNNKLFLLIHGNVEQILDDLDGDEEGDGEFPGLSKQTSGAQSNMFPGLSKQISAAQSSVRDAESNRAGFFSSVGDKPLSSSGHGGLRSKQLSAGMFFGHDSFLVPFNSIPFTYLSTSYVDLFSISSEHFLHCLSSYPEFHEKVMKYVETIYGANEALKPSQRVITFNSNTSARMRRIKREIHINKMKRFFHKRQKSRTPQAMLLQQQQSSNISPTTGFQRTITRRVSGAQHNRRGSSMNLRSVSTSPLQQPGRTLPGATGKTGAPQQPQPSRLGSAGAEDVSVVKPHSVLHIMLQTLSFLSFLYFMISLPLRIGYEDTWVSGERFVEELITDYIIDLWFVCEMILRMSKIALIDELNPHDPLLTDVKLILHSYVKSYAFAMDLLSLLPFDLIPLFISYAHTNYTMIHLTAVCLVRLRVFIRFHRFFQYFQSATFALTLLFDKSGLVELNAQTGGFGGAGSEADQTISMGEANDLLEMEGSSDESEADSDLENDLAASSGTGSTGSLPSSSSSKPNMGRRKSTAAHHVDTRSGCTRCLARINTPHAVLSHSYHTRTALLVLRLLLVVGFFIHISSCFFMYVARLQGVPSYAFNPDGTANYELNDGSSGSDGGCTGLLCGKITSYTSGQSYNWAWRAHVWPGLVSGATQYMHCMLWALETVTVIGLGSISPITSPEYLYTFFFTFLGSTLYLVMLGFLTVIVDSAFQNSHSFEQSVACADHFIEKQALPTTLRLRIHTFYHYLWFLQSGKRDENFLQNLPSHLRLDVVSYLTLPIVTAIPLFENIELGALERILLSLEPVSAGPMDVLLMQGEVSNKVVLIQKGSVDVSINPGGQGEDELDSQRRTSTNTSAPPKSAEGTTLPVLRSGNYFNERCLLLLGPSSANYVALSFCHLFTLSKRNFEVSISNYQHFKSTVKAKRERLKQHEKEKLERMRRKIERMEKERAASVLASGVASSSMASAATKILAAAKRSSGGSGGGSFSALENRAVPIPPPPPPSPPETPAPVTPASTTSDRPSLPRTVGRLSIDANSSAMTPLPGDGVEGDERALARALKKQKQHEKMRSLREAQGGGGGGHAHSGSISRPGHARAPSSRRGSRQFAPVAHHRRAATGVISPTEPRSPHGASSSVDYSAASATSPTAGLGGGIKPIGMASPRTVHRRARASLHEISNVLAQIADESSSDSDAEDTRLSLLDLQRRGTLLRTQTGSEQSGLPVGGGVAGSSVSSGLSSLQSAIGSSPSTPKRGSIILPGSAMGFRDLERSITRRLHGGSVKSFLNQAEREANEDAYSGGASGVESLKIKQEKNAAEEQEQEMSKALIAHLSGADAGILDMPAAVPALPTTLNASAPQSGGTQQQGAAKSLTGIGGMSQTETFFAPQVARTATQAMGETILTQSFLARIFWKGFCCHTRVYERLIGSFTGAKQNQPVRIFPPTSIFRVVWNIISMVIVFYYMIVVPFRLCIGLFPSDSCLGENGMDAQGYISHVIPAKYTMTGKDSRFDGFIIWYGTESERLAVQYGLWIFDAFISIFWIIDILLRCKFFPLFVHHSDGLSGMKKVTQPSSGGGGGNMDARSVQQALHDASGHHSTAAAGLSLANSVLMAKKAFMGGHRASAHGHSHGPGSSGHGHSHGPSISNFAALNQHHNHAAAPSPVLQRQTTLEQHHPASKMLHVHEHEHATVEMQSVVPTAPVPPAEKGKFGGAAKAPAARSTTVPPVFQPAQMLVQDRTTLIFEAYWASGTLKWDMLGTIPFDLVFGLWYPELASILRVARLFRVHRVFQYIHGVENFIEFYAVRINTVVLRIIEQFFILMVTIHVFGCAWFLVGRIQFLYWGLASTIDNPPVYSSVLNTTVEQPMSVNIASHYDNSHGWLCEQAFTPVFGNVRTQTNLYLFAIYYVLVCISTVGFGDIVPHTTMEMLFTAILILFGCVIYSFVTANIASLAANLDISAEVFGTKLDEIKQFMAARRLPIPLQKKIYNYYREQWHLSKGYEEENLLEEIPYYLKQALVYTMHEGLVHHHVLFTGLEENFLIHLSMALRYVLVIAGQVILQKGEVSLDMYLIRKGTVHIVLDGSGGGILDELSDGGSFNEGALFHIEEIMKFEEQSRRRLVKEQQRLTNGTATAGATTSSTPVSAATALAAKLKQKRKTKIDLMEIKEEAVHSPDSAKRTLSPALEDAAAEAELQPLDDVGVATAEPVPTRVQQQPIQQPTIRQLYAVVAVSHSVDLYTLHQRTVEDMCKLYPASSDELKRRWKEKTTVDEADGTTGTTRGSPSGDQTLASPTGQSDGTAGGPGESPDWTDGEDEDDGSSGSSTDDGEDGGGGGSRHPDEEPAPYEPPKMVVGGAPRFPSTYEGAPNAPPRPTTIHVHQHSHALHEGFVAVSGTSQHAQEPGIRSVQRSSKRNSKSLQRTGTLKLQHMNTFTSGGGTARLLNGTTNDPYNSNYDDEVVQREREKLSHRLFGNGRVWRDGSMERLRWNIISLLSLLVHCWVIPIFIAFTQIHIILDGVSAAAQAVTLQNDRTVYWVFLALAFTVDLFFLLDWYMQLRHFGVERKLEGVHWRSYISYKGMEKKLKDLHEQIQDEIADVHHAHDAIAAQAGTTSRPLTPTTFRAKRLAKRLSSTAGASDHTNASATAAVATAQSSDTETSANRSAHASNSSKLEQGGAGGGKENDSGDGTTVKVSVEEVPQAHPPLPAHMNPNSYTSLSTLPFHMDAFPSSSAEVSYAYFHQQGAWWRVCCDFIAVFPMAAVSLFIMLATGSELDFTLIALLGLNRVLLLVRVIPYLGSLDAYLDRVDHVHVSFQTRRIIKFGLLILFILHWFACGWLLFGSTSNTPDQLQHDVAGGAQTRSKVTWIMLMKEGRVQHLSEWHQYLYSVYYSICVVTTVGFGDITPTNPGEVIFTMVVILVGNVIYGCIIGAVTTSTANSSARIAEHFERLHSLRHYMQHRNISPDLMERTMTYHKHLWRTHGGINDAAVINKLPILLRKEVCYTLYGSYLAQVPFFPAQDVSFLANLSILLHPQLYLSGDLLMRKDDIGSEMCFLRSGRVRVFIYDPEELGGSLRKKITLQAAMWIGENSFFEMSLRSASVRALTHCDCLVLSNDDFQALLVNYPHYRYTIYESFVRHAEKNYTDKHVKKPVANATFIDFNALIPDEAPAPTSAAAAATGASEPDNSSSPLPSPSAGSQDVSSPTSGAPPAFKRMITITSGANTPNKTYTLTPRKRTDTTESGLPGASPIGSSSSSSALPVTPTPASPATSGPGASPSNITFASLVKLLKSSGGGNATLNTPTALTPTERNSLQQLRNQTFKRNSTFARMMDS